MRKRYCTIGGWLLLLLASSCVVQLPLDERMEWGAIPVQFALSLEAGVPATKANINILTELQTGLSPEQRFRGLVDIHTLPFAREGKVQATDEALGDSRYLPSIDEDGLIANNHAHLFSNGNVALPRGTASMLVYGRAPLVNNPEWSEQERKHCNGSLIESRWTRAASSITFSPDPICTSETTDLAYQIANILSYLVYDSNASHPVRTETTVYFVTNNGENKSRIVTMDWDANIGNTALRECFNWFTGRGQMMSGTGYNVEYMLTMLYNELNRIEEDLSDPTETNPFMVTYEGKEYAAYTDIGQPITKEMLYLDLCHTILNRFDVSEIPITISETDEINLTEALHGYPTDYGLPAGAAVLRWKGTTFVPVIHGDFDRIASADHFCYMPSLYYFANSRISTSWDETVEQVYTSSKLYWTNILQHYDSGKTVVRETRAVALDDSLQYACSMMVANVRATVTDLPDNDGNDRTNINVQAGDVFPVTGIIIGSQYRPDFNFTPMSDHSLSGEDEDIEEYYLYDNQIDGISLQYAANTNALPTFQTLVFPTPENDDVYFYLEFRNDSGTPFTGADGVILPGSHFYLAGKLEFPVDQDVEQQQGKYFTRIFTQDHYTSVSCVVSSLENAFLCVPEMETQQLRLGVKTNLNWITATPRAIILE